MKVFIPHKKDRNVYFDEIINFSKNEFVFGNYKEFDTSCDIVNIQFPEAIFNWVPPTKLELADLEQELLLWEQNAKIVLTLNDAKSHYDTTNKFDNLFNLLQRYVDGVIHLGQYSLENYRASFSKNTKHVVIFHPLYNSLLQDYKTQDIEELFAINLQDKYVVAAIGAIRSREEMQLIFKAFKNVPAKNKILVVPNMFPFLQKPNFIPYRFRKIYNYIAEKWYCYPLKKSEYYFGYKFIPYNYMINLVQKATLIIIPRVKNLNSGNLFLGLTFDKAMVIPKIGNLTEVAEFFNLPVLDLEKQNYKKYISKVIKLNADPYYSKEEYLEKKSKFHSSEIAGHYDLFFHQITTN